MNVIVKAASLGIVIGLSVTAALYTHDMLPVSALQVGKCYAFMPRINRFEYGEVVKISPIEVTFKNIRVITDTVKEDASPEKQVQLQQLSDFINSKDRVSLMRPVANGAHPEVSYSRGELTAIELDRCEK